MKALATLAGVSESTVSRALADHPALAAATRDRIKALAREHGYRINPVARAFRLRQSGAVALAIPSEAAAAAQDPFVGALVSHLADALAARGFDLMVSTASDQEAVTRLLGFGRVEAVLVWGEAPTATAGVIGVRPDWRMAGRMAAQHLLEQGRRRIGFLGDRRTAEGELRWQGFAAAHADAGVDCSGALIALDSEAFTPPSRFDALVAASDLQAVRVLRRLTESGISTPGQVAVVGYGDSPWAPEWRPALTTIGVDLIAAAATLGDRVLAHAQGSAVEGVILPVTLTPRDSSR
jgi:DNA-binding LacI/PurR family transcriptional regulator